MYGRLKKEVHIQKAEGAKLGLTLANVRGRVVIDAVAATSAAFGQVAVGSWLVAVNGVEVTNAWRLNAAEYASKLIAKSSTLRLTLLYLETIDIFVPKYMHNAGLKLETCEAGEVRICSIGDILAACDAGCGDDIECGVRGLSEGDRIVSVDGRATSSVKEALGLLRKLSGSPVEICVASKSPSKRGPKSANTKLNSKWGTSTRQQQWYDTPPCPVGPCEFEMSNLQI